MGKKKTDSIIIATVASAILMTIGIIIRVICLLNRERERERESIWKQPIFYWSLAGGFVAASLILLSLCLFRKKNSLKGKQ